MIIDKEYPATHSMATSWYVVDEDGNVGILKYGYEGPNLQSVPYDINFDDLLFGCNELADGFVRFELTDDQIMSLLKPLKSYDFDFVVKVDNERTNRFLELCENDDIVKLAPFCISDKFGFYRINARKCMTLKSYRVRLFSKDAKVRKCIEEKTRVRTIISGTLKIMRQEKLISAFYELRDYGNVNGCCPYPYYIFRQGFVGSEPAEKEKTPNIPVTIDQIPEPFRPLMQRVPLKFKDVDMLQIAQYYPCECEEQDCYIVDECYYQQNELPDQTKVYTFAGVPYADTYNYRPTVLGVRFKSEKYKPIDIFKQVLNKSMLLTLYREKSYYEANNAELLDRISEALSVFQPRLVLFSTVAYEVFSSIFDFQNNRFSFEGVSYPAYCFSEISAEEMWNYANQPYRGKEHPMLITKEQMKELVKKGKAELD